MTTAEQPRWRRLGPDQRREEILVVAQRLFAEGPYGDASTTEIAREAGITGRHTRARVHSLVRHCLLTIAEDVLPATISTDITDK